MTPLRLCLLGLLACLAGVVGCACDNQVLPLAPPECDDDGIGCLSDERCVQSRCVKLDKCEGDEDCPSLAWQCIFPSQICELRPGFDDECLESTDCEPSTFCALGRCRALETARQCARRSDCPLGQMCDRRNFLCIEEASCNLADAYPELTCDPGEVCEAFSGRCQLPCQNQCTPETVEQDCGTGMQCDGSCRCVQCLVNADCGPGLVCNQRAGRCESEDLCYDDEDCLAPLVCDPRTALCQAPPPPCETDLDCEVAEICNRTTGVCELPGGACIDDRFENADTPVTAEPLAVPGDGQPRVVDDLVLCPDDDDVYAIELDAGDNLVARVYGTVTQARATLWLLDSDGETSVRFAEAPPFGNGTISYVAQEEETIFLRLNALLGQTPYELELVRLPGEPCGDDAFEGGGGNDTLATATPPASVPTGVTLQGVLCPGDEDYLAVELEAGEGLDVNLAFDETRADLDLSLLDADTGALLATSAGIRSPERMRYRTFSDRTVVVHIRGFGNSDGGWQLSLERLPAEECEADDLEPDDEAPLLLPEAQSSLDVERTLCGLDVDRYEVPLRDFQRLVAVATYPTEDLDLALSIVDADGELLRTSPGSSGGESITYSAGADETVFLEIESLLNTEGRYTLDLFRENQVDCAPDEHEPNNGSATAAESPAAAVGLTLCGSDEDWYALEGVEGKKLRARASFIHADGDIDVMILGLNGDQILDVSDGVSNVELSEAVLPLDGTYYVRVFSLSSQVRSRYSLEVSLENVD